MPFLSFLEMSRKTALAVSSEFSRTILAVRGTGEGWGTGGTVIRQTSVVNLDGPHAGRVDLLEEGFDPLACVFELGGVLRVHVPNLVAVLAGGQLVDEVVGPFDVVLHIIDIPGEGETSVVTSEDPEVFVFYGELALLIELNDGDVVDGKALHGGQHGVGVFEPFWVEGEVHGVVVGARVQTIDKGLGHGLYPRMVDGPVVELTPKGAVWRMDDVHAQKTETSVSLNGAQLADRETEETTVIQAFVYGGGFFVLFRFVSFLLEWIDG